MVFKHYIANYSLQIHMIQAPLSFAAKKPRNKVNFAARKPRDKVNFPAGSLVNHSVKRSASAYLSFQGDFPGEAAVL